MNLVPAAHVEGLYSCLDYYQNVSDPFSKNLINRYNKLYPGDAKFTAALVSNQFGVRATLRTAEGRIGDWSG